MPWVRRRLSLRCDFAETLPHDAKVAVLLDRHAKLIERRLQGCCGWRLCHGSQFRVTPLRISVEDGQQRDPVGKALEELKVADRVVICVAKVWETSVVLTLRWSIVADYRGVGMGRGTHLVCQEHAVAPAKARAATTRRALKK